MSYCLNPECPNPADPLNENNQYCSHCGSDLLLGGCYRATQKLSHNSYETTFEICKHNQSKILKILQIDEPVAVALFQQQALLLGQLNHPGIPQVEHAGYFTFVPLEGKKPLHGLVVDKIEGLNLEEWLKTRDGQPLSEALALTWLKQLLEILQKLHQLPYFHLNIKPSNIVMSSNGQLVLIDFGAARQVIASYMKTQEDSTPLTGIHSPGYTPPEQLKHEAVVQSDFFALGRTFAYLLTGTPPLSFWNAETSEFHWRHRAPHISEELAAFLDRLMAPSLNQRPKTATEILQQLEQLTHSLQQPKSLSEPTPENGATPEIPALSTAGVSLPPLDGGSESQSQTMEPTEKTPVTAKLKWDRGSLLKKGKLFGVAGVVGFLGGMGFLFVSSTLSKSYQCHKLIAAIDRGGKEVRKLEGTDADDAVALATQLEKISTKVLDLELSDATLKPFPTRLGESYEQLSQAFRDMGEAIAVVDAAPVSKAGLDQVKEARKKAESAGKLANQAAKNADTVADEIKSYCLK